MTALVLAHYNPSLPIQLAGDTSVYRIGAVISHVFEDGSERPVAFSSSNLKELPPNRIGDIILNFWNSKVVPIFSWPPFVLITDDKPLLSILGPKKGISPLAAARMQ